MIFNEKAPTLRVIQWLKCTRCSNSAHANKNTPRKKTVKTHGPVRSVMRNTSGGSNSVGETLQERYKGLVSERKTEEHIKKRMLLRQQTSAN